MQLHLQNPNPTTYHLNLKANPDGTISIAQILHHQRAVKFSKPLTLKNTPKIYIIQNLVSHEVVYVGYTKQSVSNRLRFGLNPIHQTNYHGYSWMNENTVLITIWVFQSFSGNENEDKQLARTIQNLEAELAFYIRQQTGKWPSAQREIHFGNENQEEVLKWVMPIMDHTKTNQF